MDEMMTYLQRVFSDKQHASGVYLMVTTLAAGTLTVFVILGLFAAYYDFSGQRLRREEVNQFLTSAGETTAWGVETWLQKRVTMAEDLAYSIATSDDPDQMVNHLSRPAFEDTFIWTYYGEAADGRYHIWPHDDLPQGYDPRTRPWYNAAVQSGKTTLTEPYLDIATNVETITVATPVYKNGELLGVVGADFSTDSLSAVINATDFGGLGVAFLTTNTGKIIAHRDRQFVSKSVDVAFRGAVPEIHSDIQQLSTNAGNKIVMFRAIGSEADLNWHLGLSIDETKAFASLADFRKTAAVATILGSLFLIAVLGFVVHRLLVVPLSKARLAADAANIAKSEFLASMSHEIRTPMNGVLGMAEVLARSNLDDRQKELASIITSSSNALMTVINDILDFAKLEAGKLRLSPHSFNLRKTVFDVTTMMQARALEKDIEVIVRYAPDLPEGVVADDSRLRQILGNLIGNAVKFTEHGHVLVEVDGERDGDNVHVRFSIKDTGIGITADELPRMFEKFEQADSSHTRKFGGTGLGLAICKNIVDLMGGEITATSTPGSGSCFSFNMTLPVDDAIVSLPEHNNPVFDGARILAVDDNGVNRRVLKELMDAWDLDATIVETPQQAMGALELAATRGENFSVAILDYQMPGEDGASLAKRIQADDRFASLPLIMLSSIDEITSGTQTNGAYIHASISKPVHPSKLMDLLAQTLSNNGIRDLKEIAKAGQQPIEPLPAGERLCVVVAEDNLVNQLVIKKFIPEELYDVIIAENGEKAVELFQSHKPAMIFMDLSMPVMDGFEASRKIRELERDGDLAMTPIIATTAHVLDEDRERCRNAGMNDFVAKPIKKDALDITLSKWAKSRRSVAKAS